MTKRQRNFSAAPDGMAAKQRTRGRVALVLWGLTALAAATGWLTAPDRFMQSYMAVFAFLVTIGLGAQFFVLLHHLVGARWSVHACQYMERIARLLQFSPLLFLPIALQAQRVFPWLGAGQLDPHCSPTKVFYLGLPFFLGRSAFYLCAWCALSIWFRHRPIASTLRADANHTGRMKRLSGPAMVLFGATTVFASFDWWMSLQGRFHSAIFGVYVFAGAVVAALSLLVIVSVRERTPGGQAVVAVTEERHDIGKLLFGFVVFWVYLSFCQYLLIWYANSPNEMGFYTLRWSSPWRWLTTLLVMTHFAVPFLVLLSKTTKRSAIDLVLVSIITLFGHGADAAWLVLPALQPQGISIGVAELGALAVALSVVTSVAWFAATRGVLLHVRWVDSEVTVEASPVVRSFGPELPPILAAVSLPTRRRMRGLHFGWSLPRQVLLGTRVAAVTIVSGLLATNVFGWQLGRETYRKASSHPDFAQTIAYIEAQAPLNEYRWLDKRNGVVRIPIDRAMAIVTKEYALQPSARTVEGPVAPGRANTIGERSIP